MPPRKPREPRQKPAVKKTVSGIIQITRKGVGYLPWPQDGGGNKKEKEKEDIEISTENLGGALNGDTVEVELQGLVRTRFTGKVVAVIERAKTEFVCTLKHENNLWVAQPDDARVYRPFHIKTIPAGTKEDTKVLVRLISFYAKGEPTGEVIEVIGQAGEHRTEMNSIVLERGFRTSFPTDVAQEAKEIEKNHAKTIEAESAHRSDFRGIPTFTIDPADAKDFDDALSVQKLPDGNVEVGIHIADVSYFVREGTALDEEAVRRGTSVYLVDATIPMLPEELSAGVCSLKPNEDRLAFSAVVKMSADGQVLERRFERSIIRSQKRFVYEEAQKVLDTKNGVFFEELDILRSLARILRKKRAEKGAIDFGDNEVHFTLDAEGVPTSVARKERIETNLLVEEFMLLANREVAEFISKKAAAVPERGLVFLYRIHDEPKQDRIEELSTFVRAIGYDFGRRNAKGAEAAKYSARDIAGLLKQIEGKPEEHLIRTATLRSMAKAIYSTKNIGHFGLAFEYYTHFTSPIRRYPDVLAHRILASHLNGTPIGRSEYVTLEKMCVAASEQESKAVDAERDSIRYKQVEFLSGKIGQEFEGVISGVTDWGMYVEEKESAAEGLVRMRSIGDDFYNYSQKEYALVGQRTKKKYTLGDRVRVKLVTADITSRQLDFELVS